MRNIRFVLFLITISLVIIGSIGIEMHYLHLKDIPFLTKLTLLLLLNLTLIALFTLVFFVGKSLYKLSVEKRQRITGYKFKTRLVIILVVLTLIPASFLFLVSGVLVTNFIDHLFTPQLRQPLKSSIEIAQAVYDIEKQKALDYAQTLSAGKATAGTYSVRYLAQKPRYASETIKAAFEGKADVEIISGKHGDTVRAAVPSFREGNRTGILIVESLIPKKITDNVEIVKDSYENYLTLESWKVPLKTNYFMILGFTTLLVVFMALWIALRIAGNITEPIQNLAQATEQVAAGDLDVMVSVDRKDEIGLLVSSFNHMVQEIKDGRESLQAAYLESNNRRLFIENILKNINSGVIMLDTAGTILMLNNAACSMLGIKQEDVILKNYQGIMSMIQSEDLHNLVKGIEGTQFKPINSQVEAVIGNQRSILRVFITSLRDSEKYIGMLVVFNNITDIIMAQKAITWQEIARRIAHEIKNPLTPIKLSTERMVKKWQNRDADFETVFERSTKSIIREVDSLKQLVDDFSRFGKMPEIQKNPALIPVIIDDVVNLYKGYKGVSIRVLSPEDGPYVEVDREQIKRVMINILDNAIRAIEDKGLISITLQYDEPGNIAHISIADDGPGIEDKDKEKLFLPYFSTRKDGTGLGLAIAHRIIEEHHGHIRVGNNYPKGTVVTIEIPIKES